MRSVNVAEGYGGGGVLQERCGLTDSNLLSERNCL